MTNKLKQLTNLLKVFLVVIAFSSCEKEETNENQNKEVKNTNISIKYVSGKEIQNIISELNPEYLSTHNSNSSKSDSINDTFGVISVENILEAIDSLGNKNYSFTLTPKKPKPNSIFNLVVSTSNGNTEMAIIEYRMAPSFAQQYRSGTKSIAEFTGKILRYPFNGISSLSNKYSRNTCVQNIDEVVNCDEIIVDGGTVISSGGGGGTTTIGSTYTYTGGTGGSTTYNTGGGGGSAYWLCNRWGVRHGGGPAECSHPKDGGTWVIIFPYNNMNKFSGARSSSCCDGTNTEGSIPVNTNEPICITCVASPCDKIKNSTSSTQYMNSFTNINKPTVLALPYEYGFAQVNDTYTFSQAVGGEAVPIPNGAKNYTHTHPNRPKVDDDGNPYHGNVKIHSPEDIKALLVKCQRNNVDKTNAFGVMISDEGIFALSILEPIDLSSISTTKWKKFVDNYDIKATEILSDYRETSQAVIRKEKLQKMLLEEFKKLGLENKIGLFEGTVDNTTSTPEINWQRKKLDTSGNLTPENC